MAGAASEAAVASTRGSARAPARVASDAAIAAWVCAIPCAAVAVLAILVLGPPLGALVSPAHSPYRVLPTFASAIRPEPTEHGRYLVALGAPLLGALAVVRAPRWLPRVPASAIGPLVVGAQLALAGLVAGTIVAQYRQQYAWVYTRGVEPPIHGHYFSPATLAVAALVAGGAAAALRSPSLRRRAADALLREGRPRRSAIGLLAAAATAIWLLHAVHTDAEVGNARGDVLYHLGFTLDETFAVLNGRTPLVDFSAQYGSLWPLAIALPMAALGKTVLVYTLTLCTISGVALLAVYGALRRVTRSATAALLLYLPFLATSLFQISRAGRERSTAASYYANFPLRYALPFFLAWLTARRIERGRGGRAAAWAPFALAGLTVLNNVEFGVAALGATVAALLWSEERLGRRELRRLLADVGAGLAIAFALVSLLTLARAGSLPRLGRLVDYARLYSIGNFANLPIPGVLGVHVAIYLTYVAAIVVATVRAARGAANRVLTGLLAWSGVFGLGAGAYWVGRSHPLALKYEFSAWALALALLAAAAVRELSAARLRPTAIGAVVALFGFGVTACSLAQTATPWEQLQRLNEPFVATNEVPDPNPLVPPRDARTRRFVASLADGPNRFVVKRGAPVVLLLTTGHRIADAYGVVDVSPYTGSESMETVERVEATLDALRDAGGNTVIMASPIETSLVPLLRRRGFEVVTPNGLRPLDPKRTVPVELSWPGGGGIVKWVDTRHLHPRALAGDG